MFELPALSRRESPVGLSSVGNDVIWHRWEFGLHSRDIDPITARQVYTSGDSAALESGSAQRLEHAGSLATTFGRSVDFSAT